MKFLLLIVLFYALFWLLRRTLGHLGRGARPAAPAGRSDAEPEPMLRCIECGLHLPRHEALPGRGGVFCSEPHRAAYEQAHPVGP